MDGIMSRKTFELTIDAIYAFELTIDARTQSCLYFQLKYEHFEGEKNILVLLSFIHSSGYVSNL